MLEFESEYIKSDESREESMMKSLSFLDAFSAAPTSHDKLDAIYKLKAKGASLPEAISRFMAKEGQTLRVALFDCISNYSHKETPMAHYWYPITVKPILAAHDDLRGYDPFEEAIKRDWDISNYDFDLLANAFRPQIELARQKSAIQRWKDCYAATHGKQSIQLVMAEFNLQVATSTAQLIEDPSGFLLVDFSLENIKRDLTTLHQDDIKNNENSQFSDLLYQVRIKLVDSGAIQYKRYYQAAQRF